MTFQINPPDRREVQQILLALSHSLQNVSCNQFPFSAVLLFSPSSQFQSLTASPLAHQFPYSNPISCPTTSSLKLRVQVCLVFHGIANSVCEDRSSAVTCTGRSDTLKGIDMFWICLFVVSLLSSVLSFLLPQPVRFAVALFRAIKHMEISDACFPKDILVILRRAQLRVIWHFQAAVIQAAHIPS